MGTFATDYAELAVRHYEKLASSCEQAAVAYRNGIILAHAIHTGGLEKEAFSLGSITKMFRRSVPKAKRVVSRGPHVPRANVPQLTRPSAMVSKPPKSRDLNIPKTSILPNPQGVGGGSVLPMLPKKINVPPANNANPVLGVADVTPLPIRTKKRQNISSSKFTPTGQGSVEDLRQLQAAGAHPELVAVMAKKYNLPVPPLLKSSSALPDILFIPGVGELLEKQAGVGSFLSRIFRRGAKVSTKGGGKGMDAASSIANSTLKQPKLRTPKTDVTEISNVPGLPLDKRTDFTKRPAPSVSSGPTSTINQPSTFSRQNPASTPRSNTPNVSSQSTAVQQPALTSANTRSNPASIPRSNESPVTPMSTRSTDDASVNIRNTAPVTPSNTEKPKWFAPGTASGSALGAAKWGTIGTFGIGVPLLGGAALMGASKMRPSNAPYQYGMQMPTPWMNSQQM